MSSRTQGRPDMVISKASPASMSSPKPNSTTNPKINQIQNTQQQQNPHLLIPKTRPIPLLQMPIAKSFNLAYTFGIPLYFYLRAGALVRDPLTTSLQDLIPLATFQFLYCAICLPSFGNWVSEIDGNSSSTAASEASASALSGVGLHGKSGSLRKKGGSIQGKILPSIFSIVLALIIPPVPLAVLALVLGAPLYPTSSFPHTFVLAIQVAILGFSPLFYTHGVSATAWYDVIAAWLPFDEAGVWGGTVGCMVGGWVGAIPMALDWDREWQKWPCTVIWGVVMGWMIGRIITSVLKSGVGKRIDLSEGRGIGNVSEVSASDTRLVKKMK